MAMLDVVFCTLRRIVCLFRLERKSIVMTSPLIYPNNIGRRFVLLAIGCMVAGVGCSKPSGPTEQAGASVSGNVSDTNAKQSSPSPSSSVLTVEIAEAWLRNRTLELSEFTSIEDEAAEILVSEPGWPFPGLDLSGLTAISDATAGSLSKNVGDLYLDGVTSISDTGAKHLSNHMLEALEILGVERGSMTLSLKGLSTLSDDAAHSLGKHKGVGLILGLTELSNAQAERLASYEGELELPSLTELSDEAAQRLAKCDYLTVDHDKLPPSASKILKAAGH